MAQKTKAELQRLAKLLSETRSLHSIARQMIEYQKPLTPVVYRLVCAASLHKFFGVGLVSAMVIISEMDD